MRTFLTLLTNTIITACFCLTLTVVSAQAAVWTVTTTEDTNDGVCDADCSLREAIAAANPSGGDQILFDSPFFDGAQTITLSDSVGFQTLVINKALTIAGPGANLLTVRRSASATTEFHIFEIGTVTVDLSGLTIAGGRADSGGGINNTGMLTLSRSAVTGCSTSFAGGGVFNAPGASLSINESTVSGNTSGLGGGIAGFGTITIAKSTISSNWGSDGGGIATFNTTNATTLTITNSTISNNSAHNSSGGILEQKDGATLRNTIVADNTARTGKPDIAGTFISQGYNLVGNGSGATITTAVGDQIGTSSAPIDPRLGVLQNNGGRTETRAFLPGSPALDKGDDGSAAPATDQRGVTRPVELDDITYPNAPGGDGSDIGAFEADVPPSGSGFLSPYVVTKTVDSDDGVCNANCSLREAITATNANAGADIITFNIAGAGPHIIQLASVLPDLTQSVKILNTSGVGITIRGEGAADPYSIFTINAGQIVTISGLTITNGAADAGGGVLNNGGVLTINNATISNNNAFGFGGGGIYNGPDSTLIVTGSTIAGNTTAGNGGGIAGSGTITVTNSTIGGNNADAGGGFVTYANTTLTLTGCTISNNSTLRLGGGILDQSTGGATLRNTIVGDNTAGSTNPDLGGTFNSGGFNLIENVSGATINETQNAGTNITGQDPNLGPLQNNGGPTQTRALLPGSPAIEAGMSFGLTRDQRGANRPVEDPSIPNGPGDGADIGAFETQTADSNRSPVARNDSYSTTRNNTLIVSQPGILANDTDVDSVFLSAVKTTDPSHGTVTVLSNGGFEYTPNANYAGTDSFTYKVTDGSAESDIATVTITIPNNAPTALDESYSIGRNMPLTVKAPGVLANDSDLDNDTLTAILVDAPLNGSLTLDPDGGFTYTPSGNYDGPDSFKYKATDGSADSDIATVTINILNSLPTALDESYSTGRNMPLTIKAPGVLSNDSDPDNDTLTAFLVDGPLHGSLTLDPDGGFTYTPSGNYVGPDSFNYRAHDSGFESNAATVTINITNNAPTAFGESYSTGKNLPLTVGAPGVLANDSDPDNDALAAILVTGPLHGSLTLNPSGGFMYTPAGNYVGPDSFIYTANDGVADSDPVEVTLTVNAAGSTTLTVTKADDTRDGSCDADCSLREAIAAAVSGDTIQFSGFFNSPRVITLADVDGFRDLVVTKSLTIIGKGPSLLTINRTVGSFRIFNINGIGVQVTLKDLTVSGGKPSVFNGGGINVNSGASLDVSSCRISGNQAGRGGGIYVESGSTLNLTGSTVSGNIASISGSSAGGIHNEGTLTITNSTISGNDNTNPGVNGGGIWTNNTTTISNSTVTDNQVPAGNPSGIFRSGTLGTVTLHSTIVAANRDNSTRPDVAGEFVSSGYNLIGNADGATGFSQTGDQVGTSAAVLDPRLAPLGFYGGATRTHALLSNSSAVNAGDPNDPVVTDQRGISRTIGGRADIGAFEVNFTFSNSPTGSGGQGTMPTGLVGHAYNAQFSVIRSNNLSFEKSQKRSGLKRELSPEGILTGFRVIAGSLPNGLTLNLGGQLSGTPTQAGMFAFILKYDDPDGMAGAQAYVLNIFGPTAAEVSISGRVTTAAGVGIRNATVMITGGDLPAPRYAVTGSFGTYVFEDLPVGETYVLQVAAKRFRFAEPNRIFTLEDAVTNLDFVANPQN